MESNIVLIPLPLADFTALIQSCINTALTKKENLDSQLINSDDVQQIFKVSHTTLQKWRNAGRIPFNKVGNKIFYNREDVLKAIKKPALQQ